MVFPYLPALRGFLRQANNQQDHNSHTPTDMCKSNLADSPAPDNLLPSRTQHTANTSKGRPASHQHYWLSHYRSTKYGEVGGGEEGEVALGPVEFDITGNGNGVGMKSSQSTVHR